jgi:hypothetical protein
VARTCGHRAVTTKHEEQADVTKLSLEANSHLSLSLTLRLLAMTFMPGTELGDLLCPPISSSHTRPIRHELECLETQNIQLEVIYKIVCTALGHDHSIASLGYTEIRVPHKVTTLYSARRSLKKLRTCRRVTACLSNG